MGVVAQLVALLDALPDAGRGLLGGLLLLLLLLLFDVWAKRAGAGPAPPEEFETRRERWRRLRKSFAGYRWRIAHTKTSLLALLLVPLVIAVLPNIRMPVYVDALPASSASALAWVNVVVGVWLVISTGLAVRLLLRWRVQPQSLWLHRATAASTDAAVPALANTQFDEAPVAIANRQAHWQRRLGFQRAVALRIGPVSEPLSRDLPYRVIDLPKASAHWPAAATDVALIIPLCHLSLQHHRWLRFAALMGCLYWPFAYTRQTLPMRLGKDFELAARELAQSCYRDPLGFKRAEKQLHDRLDPGQEPPPVAPEGAGEVNAEDPYGRVFMVFAQALLVVYVLTGTTLKEIPDDSNFQYAEFVQDWYKKFERSIKYAEDADSEPNPPAEP